MSDGAVDTSGLGGFQSIPLHQDVEGHHQVGQIVSKPRQVRYRITLLPHNVVIMEKVVSTAMRTFHSPCRQILTLAGSSLAR